MAYEIGVHHGRRDMDRMGIFAEMKYISTDKYKSPLDGPKIRDKKGRQMYPGGPKIKAGLEDCYFSQAPEFQNFKRIFEGEAWNDMIRLQRRQMLMEKQKNVTTQTFIPSSYPEKHATIGDNFGTFTFEPIPAFSPALRPKVKKEPERAFFGPGNGKKGGPGYKDITIGDYPEYSPSPYGYRVMKSDFKDLERDIPFLGGGPGRLFNPNPYIDTKKGGPKKTYKEDFEDDTKRRGNFYLPGPTKSLGGMMDGCFEEWPEHTYEPYIPQHAVQKVFDKMMRAKSKAIGTQRAGPFYPQVRGRTKPTFSTMQKNVDFRMSTDNWRNMKPVTFNREIV